MIDLYWLINININIDIDIYINQYKYWLIYIQITTVFENTYLKIYYYIFIMTSKKVDIALTGREPERGKILWCFYKPVNFHIFRRETWVPSTILNFNECLS